MSLVSVLMFVCGISLLLAALLSWWWHHIDNRADTLWDKRRRLDLLEAGARPHPSEAAEVDEEMDALRAELPQLEKLQKLANRVRSVGVALLYASCFAGGMAMVIGGFKGLE